MILDGTENLPLSSYKNIPLEGINYIGVDEFSISEGHEYMTIFTDLEAARIIHAVKGRAKEDIRPFLEKLRKRARSLKAVAMDMSGSYYHAVSETLPGVDIVFDHYHVSALANQSIDELRREQQKELDALGKQTLKGSRFLLLKNYDNLSVDHKERLHDLLCANEPLFTAHCRKNSLGSSGNSQIWRAPVIFLRSGVRMPEKPESRRLPNSQRLWRAIARDSSITSSTGSAMPQLRGSTTRSKPSKLDVQVFCKVPQPLE